MYEAHYTNINVQQILFKRRTVLRVFGPEIMASTKVKVLSFEVVVCLINNCQKFRPKIQIMFSKMQTFFAVPKFIKCNNYLVCSFEFWFRLHGERKNRVVFRSANSTQHYLLENVRFYWNAQRCWKRPACAAWHFGVYFGKCSIETIKYSRTLSAFNIIDVRPWRCVRTRTGIQAPGGFHCMVRRF